MSDVPARLVEVKGRRATLQLLYGPRRTLILQAGLEQQVQSAVGREGIFTVHDNAIEAWSSGKWPGDSV